MNKKSGKGFALLGIIFCTTAVIATTLGDLSGGLYGMLFGSIACIVSIRLNAKR